MARTSTERKARAAQRPASVAAQTPASMTLPLRQAVYDVYRWMVEPASEPYYESLTVDGKRQFNELSALAGQLHFSLQAYDLDILAARASVQMDALNKAIADIRERLEEQRRLGDALAAISTFLSIVIAIVL